jgi:hypothetical protein
LDSEFGLPAAEMMDLLADVVQTLSWDTPPMIVSRLLGRGEDQVDACVGAQGWLADTRLGQQRQAPRTQAAAPAAIRQRPTPSPSGSAAEDCNRSSWPSKHGGGHTIDTDRKGTEHIDADPGRHRDGLDDRCRWPQARGAKAASNPPPNFRRSGLKVGALPVDE